MDEFVPGLVSTTPEVGTILLHCSVSKSNVTKNNPVMMNPYTLMKCHDRAMPTGGDNLAVQTGVRCNAHHPSPSKPGPAELSKA